jgi:hypothetical protein
MACSMKQSKEHMQDIPNQASKIEKFLFLNTSFSTENQLKKTPMMIYKCSFVIYDDIMSKYIMLSIIKRAGHFQRLVQINSNSLVFYPS